MTEEVADVMSPAELKVEIVALGLAARCLMILHVKAILEMAAKLQ